MTEPLAEIEAQEHALAGFRIDPEEAGAMLADEFFEFGKSGRVWSRAEVVTALGVRPPASVRLGDCAVRLLADGVAHTTYRPEPADGAAALRSSIWVHRGGRWRMLFHQGTPLP